MEIWPCQKAKVYLNNLGILIESNIFIESYYISYGWKGNFSENIYFLEFSDRKKYFTVYLYNNNGEKRTNNII